MAKMWMCLLCSRRLLTTLHCGPTKNLTTRQTGWQDWTIKKPNSPPTGPRLLRRSVWEWRSDWWQSSSRLRSQQPPCTLSSPMEHTGRHLSPERPGNYWSRTRPFRFIATEKVSTPGARIISIQKQGSALLATTTTCVTLVIRELVSAARAIPIPL